MAEDTSAKHDTLVAGDHTHERLPQTGMGLEPAVVSPREGTPSFSLLNDPRLKHSANRPVNIALMLQAQQTYGNRALRRMLQSKRAAGATTAPNQVQRQEEKSGEKAQAVPQADSIAPQVQATSGVHDAGLVAPSQAQQAAPLWGRRRDGGEAQDAPTQVKRLWARQSSSGDVVQRQIHTAGPVPISRSVGGVTIQRVLSAQQKKDYATFIGSTYKWPNRTAGKNGKFDLIYDPAAKTMDVTVKVKFDFPDVPGNTVLDKATRENYRKNYIKQVQAAWSNRYTFKNVRAPQEAWKKLNPVTVNVQVVEDNANPHFLIEAYIKTEGGAQVSGGNLGAFNTTELYKGDDTPQAAFNPGTKKGELERIRRINPSPILFANNSAIISAKFQAPLSFLATYIRRINNPKFDIDIVGHASATGKAGPNLLLSEQRAKAVESLLKKNGLTNHNLKVKSVGSAGATKGAKWRKVEITANVPAGWQNMQDVTAHEFGHMLGLGDEYKSPIPGKGTKKATHYNLVLKAFGKEYAQQVAKRGDTDYASIMESGNDVRIQHYVTFWEALAETTLHKAAVPTPKFGYNDWKFIG